MKLLKNIVFTCFCVVLTLVFTLNNPSLALANCDGFAFYPQLQYGGGGGSPFTNLAQPGTEVGAIRIRHGKRIDSIQIGFRSKTNPESINFAPKQGGNGGTQTEFYLNPDEFINQVRGRSGTEIDNLEFRTNRGRIFGNMVDKEALLFQVLAFV